ncbi:MAG: SHOCT domain-containing protein [Azospirillaceae bacterium]
MTGGLIMILFWVGLIVALALAIRYLGWPGDQGRQRGGRADPLDILRERYARGEIDDEEYQRRRRTLEDHRS